MCGICGFYGFNDKALISKMTSLLEHRGPDDFGIYSDKGIELGHRRLSIIDLSKAGKQPMTNEDGSVVIVFNGEIYNFQKIKDRLKNHHFISNSDTEVLIHGYEEWGLKGLLSRLNGMFAFALWDSKKKSLFLARDRLGIKPLYYSRVGEEFIFASEIKTILEYDKVEREVDAGALSDYLSLRYVPGPKTLFEGILCLEPGHFAEVSKGFFSVEQYWTLTSVQGTGSEKYYSKMLHKLLRASVKRRMLSDVPLGAYLSGGIDSAAIVALMNEMTEEPVKTFTIGFGNETNADELARARKISELIGTDHQELIIRAKHFKELPKIIWHLDQPYGDFIIIPNYYLSQLARKKVTVVLSGEGADELFAGYVQYKNLVMGNMLNKAVPRYLQKKMVIPAIKRVPISLLDVFFHYQESIGEQGRKRMVDFVNDLDNLPKSYVSNIVLFNEDDKKNLLTEYQKARLKGLPSLQDDVEKHFAKSGTDDMLAKVMLREIKTWLPGNILFRNDKMSMANSVECRVPFLDHKLVEFSANIPSYMKIKRLTEKHIFRRSMRGTLPRFLTQRKKKAFYVPVKDEYYTEMFDIAKKVLSESDIRKNNFFKYDYIKKRMLDDRNSRFISGKQLITIINFELWHKIFIEGEKVRSL